MEALNLIAGIMIFNTLWALYTTFKKEKIMVADGEGTLPSSVYGYLILRNLLRLTFTYLLGPFFIMFLQEFVGYGDSYHSLIIIGFIIALIVEGLSVIVETIFRIVHVNIMFKAEQKKEDGNE